MSKVLASGEATLQVAVHHLSCRLDLSWSHCLVKVLLNVVINRGTSASRPCQDDLIIRLPASAVVEHAHAARMTLGSTFATSAASTFAAAAAAPFTAATVASTFANS